MSNARVPANDLDVEGALLGALMLEPHLYDECPWLKPHHFYADANARILEAFLGVREQGLAIDLPAISTWLKDRDRLKQVGGTPYLAELMYQPAVTQVAQHARTLFDKWRLRQLSALTLEANAESYAPVEDTQALISDFERKVAELLTLGEARKLEHAATVAHRQIEVLIRARERGDSLLGISTGFVDADKKCGGLFAGDLYIVAARPGMGKTSFAVSLACNLARPKHVAADGTYEPGDAVALFSLEMPRDQIALRIACHEGELEFQRVRTGQINRDEWSRLVRAASDMSAMPFFIDDTPAISVQTVRDRIRQLKREIANPSGSIVASKLGLVVVDYLQLMTGVKEKGANREQEVASITRGLKALAKDEQVAIIAVSQLNRSTEKNSKDKRPQLSDLRESGAIEQDADTVIFIYRDEYYDRNTPTKGVAEVDFAKQRNGPTGIVKLTFLPHCMRFHNLALSSDDYGEWEEGM
jgi:replicative DNA helicase